MLTFETLNKYYYFIQEFVSSEDVPTIQNTTDLRLQIYPKHLQLLW